MKQPKTINKQPIIPSCIQWLSQISFIHRVLLIYLFLHLCTLYAWQVVSIKRSRSTTKPISRIYSYLFYLLVTKFFCSILVILHNIHSFCIYMQKQVREIFHLNHDQIDNFTVCYQMYTNDIIYSTMCIEPTLLKSVRNINSAQ